MPQREGVTPQQVMKAYSHLELMLEKYADRLDGDGALPLTFPEGFEVLVMKEGGEVISYARVLLEPEVEEVFLLWKDGRYTSSIAEDGVASAAQLSLPVREILSFDPESDCTEVGDGEFRARIENLVFAESMRESCYTPISIAGLPKARVLATLLNVVASYEEYPGRGLYLKKILTGDEARELYTVTGGQLKREDGFPFDLDLRGDQISLHTYNQLCGEGVGEAAIARLQDIVNQDDDALFSELKTDKQFEEAIADCRLTGGELPLSCFERLRRVQQRTELLHGRVAPSYDLDQEIREQLAQVRFVGHDVMVPLCEEKVAWLTRGESYLAIWIAGENNEQVGLEDYVLEVATDDGRSIPAEQITYLEDSCVFHVSLRGVAGPFTISLRPASE